MITLNGQNRDHYEDKTVEELIHTEGFDQTRIAVEVNGGIISKCNYNQTILHAGDVIEVVSFVGGG